MLLLIFSGIIIVIADQAVKYWAFVSLKPVGRMDFIRIGDFDVLGFLYTENDGAAFSILSGQRVFLIVFDILLIFFLIFYTVRFCKDSRLEKIAAVMVMGGGLGNLVDRIRLGYVIDYLEVRMFDFAIFNLADTFVVVGAVILLLKVILPERKEIKEND